MHLGPIRSRSLARTLCAALTGGLLLIGLAPVSAQEQGRAAEEQLDEPEDLFADEALDDDDDLFGDDEIDRPVEEEPAPDAAGPVSTDDTGASGMGGEDPEEEALEPVAPIAPGTTPSTEVEEILITGTAASGAEIAPATSKLSFDESDLLAMGIEDVGDVGTFTPNLEVRRSGSTTANFFIRGVGLSDFSANAAGAVAIYSDDVPLNSPALQVAPIFDAAAIDVLRGPQGTGAGRNASAGAIKISNVQPTGEFTSNFRAGVGQFVSSDAIDAFRQSYEGAVGFPVLSEVLAARVSFRFQEWDPYKKNRCGGLDPVDERPTGQSVCGERAPRRPTLPSGPDIPAGLSKEIGEHEDWAARIQLRFEVPDTDLSLVAKVEGSRLDEDPTFGQAAGTGNDGLALGSFTSAGYVEQDQARERQALVTKFLKPKFGLTPIEARDRADDVLAKNLAADRPLDLQPYEGDYNRDGHTKRDIISFSLRADYQFDAAQFRSISSFDYYDRSREGDSDFTPDTLFHLLQDDDAWQFSQDLRLSGELEEEPLAWDVGAFYLMENLDASVEFELSQAQGNNLQRRYDQNLYSYGVYGQLSWEFLDDFVLEGGVRYNWERKKFSIEQAILRPDSSREQATWSEPTGTIKLIYNFNDDVSSYMKYTHGWKAGTFNANTPGSPATEPEVIDAFEWGFEGSWLDARINMSGALFHYLYEDYQVFIFRSLVNSPPTLEVINANDARVLGAELDATFQPLLGFVPEFFEEFRTTVRAGWLSSEFLDFSVTDIRQSAGGGIPVEIDFSGNQLISSPEFQVSATVDWPFDFGRFGRVIPRYDLSWTDDVFFDPTEGRGSTNLRGQKPEFTTGQPDYFLHNVRLTYLPNESVEVAGWCRNVTDERYKNYSFDATNFTKLLLTFVGEPRTCGFELAFRW
jgi:iron complex outermembrane receptor protein